MLVSLSAEFARVIKITHMDSNPVRTRAALERQLDTEVPIDTNGKPFRPKFSDMLRFERTRGGLTVRELADRCGVSLHVAQSWEDGGDFPNKFQFKKLIGSLRKMRHHQHLLPERSIDVEETIFDDDEAPESLDLSEPIRPLELTKMPVFPTIETSEAPIPVPIESNTFANSLRQARSAARLTRAELAEILSVSDSAIAQWETETNCPIQSHYDMLLSLFPQLHEAPRPNTRVMTKPGRTDQSPIYARSDAADSPPMISSPELLAPMNRPPATPVDSRQALIQLGKRIKTFQGAFQDMSSLRALLQSAHEAGLSVEDLIHALCDD